MESVIERKLRESRAGFADEGCDETTRVIESD
jgi:hypothetical protein